jgi:hypothetical protein
MMGVTAREEVMFIENGSRASCLPAQSRSTPSQTMTFCGHISVSLLAVAHRTGFGSPVDPKVAAVTSTRVHGEVR